MSHRSCILIGNTISRCSQPPQTCVDFPRVQCVGKGRTDHDATVTQCNPTTVEMIPEKGADVTTANADVKHMSNEDASAKRCTSKSTQEHGINEDDEQGTWIQVVDRRRKRKEQTK